MKGKFYLKEFPGNYIVFQVLEMDERFRRKPEEGEKFYVYSDNDGIDIEISSSEFPMIKQNILPRKIYKVYLRGATINLDYNVSVYKSDSSKKDIERIKKALREWAEKWEGWDKEKEKNKDDVIFIV